jgi:hypothetical protein
LETSLGYKQVAGKPGPHSQTPSQIKKINQQKVEKINNIYLLSQL